MKRVYKFNPEEAGDLIAEGLRSRGLLKEAGKDYVVVKFHIDSQHKGRFGHVDASLREVEVEIAEPTKGPT